MKKYIFIAILMLFPLTTKASTLYGFGNGNYYSDTGTLQYICFLDNSCLKNDGTETTREALGLSSIATPTSSSVLPSSTPAVVYVPVYLPSTSTNISNNSIVGGENITNPVQASPTSSSIEFSCDGNYNVIFNGQTVLQNCSADHPELSNSTNSSTLRDWVTINGLQPLTTYPYQVIVNGQTLNESFTTSN